MKRKYLFTPIKIGSCVIPNRLVVPAMVANICPDQGKASEQYTRYHEKKANGGVRPVSCSPIADAWTKETPRELTVPEIRQIV